MGKDKLRKFRENETFKCLIQPATSEVLNCDHPMKGNWARDFFGNDNPIVVELGCGKGDYTIDLAERNPAFNYIGVDIKGARLWKGAKYAEEHGLKNVGFLRTRIEFIESIFAPGEVAEIWITFADPQIGREKKRLTAPLFMSRYRNFLKPGGIMSIHAPWRSRTDCLSWLVQQTSTEQTASAFMKADCRHYAAAMQWMPSLRCRPSMSHSIWHRDSRLHTCPSLPTAKEHT